MPWQVVPLSRLVDAQPLGPDGLHVWWWPEETPSPASARRGRVDRLLRTVLAPYLGLPSDALRFGRESKGRPFLLHAGAPDFNLSDTRGGSVLAVAAKGRVGIDIERRDRELPALALASRWFAPDEAEALRVLAGRDADAARRAFLRLWTAKEASCKSTGTGIYARLSAWRFAIAEDDAAPTALNLPEEAGDGRLWRFWRLSPAPTHTVALACRDLFTAPRCFRVTDGD